MKSWQTHTICYGNEIFIEKGAKIKAAVNAENGPIYVDKDGEVQEGSVIRGPFSVESSVVNMGQKFVATPPLAHTQSWGVRCLLASYLDLVIKVTMASRKLRDGE